MDGVFWYEKAKLNWHISRDRNTTFSHMMPKIKRSKIIISTIKDGNSLITDQDQMAFIAINYFTNLLCFAGNVQNNSMVDDTIPKLVNTHMNGIMTVIPSS